MDEPDKDETVRPLDDLEPEARRLLLNIGLGFWATVLTVYIVFAVLYEPWDAVFTLGTIAGIAGVALILHRLQTIQFSLKTVLIAILTLQIPMGVLLTSKTSLQTNLGIVALLVWSAGAVTYVLVTAHRSESE